MPDYECTWWPDNWFGINITDLCIKHDLGGSDIDLAIDVASRSPILIPVGIAMYVGLRTFGVIYRRNKRK